MVAVQFILVPVRELEGWSRFNFLGAGYFFWYVNILDLFFVASQKS